MQSRLKWKAPKVAGTQEQLRARQGLSVVDIVRRAKLALPV